MKRKAPIKGIIWDLDNTLYRTDPDLIEAIHYGFSKVAIDRGLDMKLEDAVNLARKSFAETGYSARHFIERFRISDHDLHHGFHQHVDVRAIAIYPELPHALGDIDTVNAIVTHSPKDWAFRVLDHLGIRRHFDDSRIFGMEDYDYQKKSDSRLGFERALVSMSLAAEHVVVVEDTLHNLKLPHQMGMGTILMDHGQTLPSIPHYVHVACPTLGSVIETIRTTGKQG